MDETWRRKSAHRRRPLATLLAAVSRLLLVSVAAYSVASAATPRAAAQDESATDEEVVVFGHPVYIFEYSDAGFAPASLRTDPGKSAIFIRNLTMFSQRFTVTRKRDGRRKLLFSGETVGGQSITGTTKFRSGDVFIVREASSGQFAKIFVD